MPKYKKGQSWNKPLNSEMKEFKRKTGKNPVYNGKITGNFEYWLWQIEKKKAKSSTPVVIKPKAKPSISKEIEKDYNNLKKKDKMELWRIYGRSRKVHSEDKQMSKNNVIMFILEGRYGKSQLEKWSSMTKTPAKPKMKPKNIDFESSKKIMYNIFIKNNSKPLTTNEIKERTNQININHLKELKLYGWIKYRKDKDRKLKWSPTALWNIPRQKPKLSTKWNKLSQKKRVALLTKEHDFDEYYAKEVKRKIWNELPDQIKKDIKKYPNRIEDMSIINEELFEEYYGEKFDPDLIEKGDYVNFGPYGNMYVVFRVDEKRFWVTDLKNERYNDNAPGWNIRVNYAKKIIRKG